MRTAATILLLVILSLTQTPLGQLLKMPVLIQHFYKHKKQDGVSLLRFLKDHYSTRHNDADQSQDDRLPFRTVMVQSVGFAVVPAGLKADFSLKLEVPEKVTPIDLSIPRQHLSTIFHPPRA